MSDVMSRRKLYCTHEMKCTACSRLVASVCSESDVRSGTERKGKERIGQTDKRTI